jgi:hypothetical protein
MAIGSFELDLDCADIEDGSAHCTLKTNTNMETTVSAKSLPADAECSDNAKVYQSWQLEGWHRQYRLTPGAAVTPPPNDTGPSFTLRNVANGGVFECAPLANKSENVFSGVCAQATALASVSGSAAANTTATFQFDPVLDMLVISQSWECSPE